MLTGHSLRAARLVSPHLKPEVSLPVIQYTSQYKIYQVSTATWCIVLKQLQIYSNSLASLIINYLGKKLPQFGKLLHPNSTYWGWDPCYRQQWPIYSNINNTIRQNAQQQLIYKTIKFATIWFVFLFLEKLFIFFLFLQIISFPRENTLIMTFLSSAGTY